MFMLGFSMYRPAFALKPACLYIILIIIIKVILTKKMCLIMRQHNLQYQPLQSQPLQ